jgi:hypothetical protein
MTQELRPRIEGRFETYAGWVDFAYLALTRRKGSTGEHLPAVCIDAKGRRCHVSKDFMRARDENAFPVVFFWDCEPQTTMETDT